MQSQESGASFEKIALNFISLEKLVKLFLDVDLDKTFQVADWRIRPLPKGMLDYARNDSHYLISVYMLIQEMCESKFQFAKEATGVVGGRSMTAEFLGLEWLNKVKGLQMGDYDLMGNMALMINKFITQKLCKNNYIRVVTQE